MGFLNIVMLGGALAASVPLVIHLFNRSRFKVVPWGAMHLLESVVRVNRRRMNIENLLLLLLRCAIPVVLALCMAQPVITAWQTIGGNVPSSVVLLVDDSYSMDAGQAGDTALDAARNAARQVIANLPTGSEVSIITMWGRAATIVDGVAVDPKTASDRIYDIEWG